MQANLTNTFIRPYAAMIYQTNDGGPGKGGPLAQVWRWLCKFTAESLPQPQVCGSTSTKSTASQNLQRSMSACSKKICRATRDQLEQLHQEALLQPEEERGVREGSLLNALDGGLDEIVDKIPLEAPGVSPEQKGDIIIFLARQANMVGSSPHLMVATPRGYDDRPLGWIPNKAQASAEWLVEQLTMGCRARGLEEETLTNYLKKGVRSAGRLEGGRTVLVYEIPYDLSMFGYQSYPDWMRRHDHILSPARLAIRRLFFGACCEPIEQPGVLTNTSPYPSDRGASGKESLERDTERPIANSWSPPINVVERELRQQTMVSLDTLIQQLEVYRVVRDDTPGHQANVGVFSSKKALANFVRFVGREVEGNRMSRDEELTFLSAIATRSDNFEAAFGKDTLPEELSLKWAKHPQHPSECLQA